MSDGPARLFLMQHYGLPTRLLDWSESPLVALYFAVMEEGPGPAILYALNPFELNERQVGQRAILAPTEKAVRSLIVPPFRDAPPPDSEAAALLVNESDPRMLAQLTALTIHASPNSLESIEGAEAFLRRYEILESARKPLLMELWRHGVRRSTLFPDLANLAAELGALTFTKAYCNQEA